MIRNLAGEDYSPVASGYVKVVRRGGQRPVAYPKATCVHGEFDVLTLDEKTAADAGGWYCPFLFAGESQDSEAPAGAFVRTRESMPAKACQ